MFKTRLISGIVLVAVAIVLMVTGNEVLLTAMLAISLIGMFELYRVLKIEKTLLAIVSYLVTIVFYCNLEWNFISDNMVVVMIYIIALMFVYVLSYPKFEAYQLFGAFFGLFYVGVMLSFIYPIRMLDKGAYLVWLVFLCSWGCDTCAYCVGKLWGKAFGNHKMSPKLSPNKSIEGAVGGVVGAFLLTVLYAFIFKNQMDIAVYEIFILAAISAVGGLISMIGDLTASAIKRNYDIKDYGKLIPGHGGILDRFDSMIITAPIIFYMAYYLM